MGADRIYKYGEGNAEGNKTEDDFNEWKTNLWKEIFDEYAKSETVTQRKNSLTIALEKHESIKTTGIEFSL